MKKMWLIRIIVILVLIGFVFLLTSLDNGVTPVKNNSGDGTRIPNPASVYCIEHGGNLTIRSDANGGQYGVCILTNGTECDEWKYFNNNGTC